MSSQGRPASAPSGTGTRQAGGRERPLLRLTSRRLAVGGLAPGGADFLGHGLGQRHVVHGFGRLGAVLEGPVEESSTALPFTGLSCDLWTRMKVAAVTGRNRRPAHRSAPRPCRARSSSRRWRRRRAFCSGWTNLPALFCSWVGQLVLLGVGVFDVADRVLQLPARRRLRCPSALAGGPLDGLASPTCSFHSGETFDRCYWSSRASCRTVRTVHR